MNRNRPFARAFFDAAGYRGLKQRYDPRGLLGDLFEKCVLRR